MNWNCGISSRVPALQVQSQSSNPVPPNKKKREERNWKDYVFSSPLLLNMPCFVGEGKELLLGIESKALCKLGRHSITELVP
jgi:hypothetical protein